MSRKIYQSANFILDTKTRRFYQHGRTVPISSKAFDILEYLVENHGKVVKKSELLENVWPDSFVEESNLPVHISALRRILREKKGESQFIKTIPGRGYCFIAPVQELNSVPESTINLPQKSTNQNGFVEPLSIAVLPFTFDFVNADFEYLANGITQSLINDLSQMENLKVLAYSAVRDYRQTKLEIQEIGFLLGANRILTGHISGYKNDLEITVEMVNAGDKSHVWGAQQLFNFNDIFLVKKEISLVIAEKLKLKLTASDKQIFARQEANHEAQKLYFRGKFVLESSLTKSNIKDSLLLALNYFQQAIEKDSNYALAYTGIGSVYVTLHTFCFCQPSEAHAEIQKALEMALKSDDQLSEIFVLKGRAENIFERQYEQAQKSFGRAIELNPNNADAYYRKSNVDLLLGKFDSAATMINKAIQLDPISLLFNEHLIRINFFSGEYNKAIAEAEDLLEFEKNSVISLFYVALCYAHLGFVEQSLENIEKAFEIQPSAEMLLLKAYVLALTGNKNQTEEIISDVLNQFPENQIDSADLAFVYSALGQIDKAFELLDKAFEVNSANLSLLKVERRVDNLRQDLRFQQLLEKLNLS
jgi:DNA-binding winged helix-turn-helix (wHTH) protein/tetratricopeptide (TPR) repeat protein